MDNPEGPVRMQQEVHHAQFQLAERREELPRRSQRSNGKPLKVINGHECSHTTVIDALTETDYDYIPHDHAE